MLCTGIQLLQYVMYRYTAVCHPHAYRENEAEGGGTRVLICTCIVVIPAIIINIPKVSDIFILFRRIINILALFCHSPNFSKLSRWNKSQDISVLFIKEVCENLTWGYGQKPLSWVPFSFSSLSLIFSNH